MLHLFFSPSAAADKARCRGEITWVSQADVSSHPAANCRKGACKSSRGEPNKTTSTLNTHSALPLTAIAANTPEIQIAAVPAPAASSIVQVVRCLLLRAACDELTKTTTAHYLVRFRTITIFNIV